MLTKIMGIGFLLSFLFFVLTMFSAIQAIAQVAAAPVDTSAGNLWEVILKIAFPALWTVASPFFTKGITWGLLKIVNFVPQSVQIVISSVVGATIAGLAGAIPEFPLTTESAAQMGAASGATGQVLASLHPNAVQPVGNQTMQSVQASSNSNSADPSVK